MATPFETVEVLGCGYALLESQAALGVEGFLDSTKIDVIDFLPNASSGIGPGGDTVKYTYRATLADPRSKLYYQIHAVGAAGVPAPGYLLIYGGPLDPVTASDGGITRLIHRVVISGPVFQFYPSAALKPAHCGCVDVEARFLQLSYVNGAVAQATFSIGVYLRPF